MAPRAKAPGFCGRRAAARDRAARPRRQAPRRQGPSARAAKPIIVTKAASDASSQKSRKVQTIRAVMGLSSIAYMYMLCSLFDPGKGENAQSVG